MCNSIDFSNSSSKYPLKKTTSDKSENLLEINFALNFKARSIALVE